MEHDKKRAVSHDGLVIAENLRSLRKFAGLSLHDVGLILGVSHQQIQKYESGHNRLPLQVLPALCDAFGVPVEAFLRGVEYCEPDADAADLQQLQRSFGQIGNVQMRRKILQVIEILAA